MFEKNPLRFTDLQKMKATCPSHLQSIFDDDGLIASSHASAVPTKSSAEKSDKEGKRGKRAALEDEILKAQSIAKNTNRDPHNHVQILEIFSEMIADGKGGIMDRVLGKEGVAYKTGVSTATYRTAALKAFLNPNKKKKQQKKPS